MSPHCHASLRDLLGNGVRFAEVSLDDLAKEWRPEGILRVPAFQRLVVWDEKKVALLWDSVLRGMPIGALLVTTSRELLVRVGQDGRADPLDPALVLVEAGEDHLALLDGQQRAATLASGWRRPGPDDDVTERLWIDLAFDPTHDKQGRRYALYQCTTALPWGPGDEDDTRRRSARDANIKEFLKDPGSRTRLADTWPRAAVAPVPFAGILDAHRCGELEGSARALLPRDLGKLGDADQKAITETITRLGRAALNRAMDLRIPVLRIDASPNAVEVADSIDGDSSDRESDVLSQVFSRLNSAGVPLDQAELFLSAVKARWPDALRLISNVRDKAGGILSAQQIVHLAVRVPDVAQAGDKFPDMLRLTLREFHQFETRLKKAGTDLKAVLKPRFGESPGSLANVLLTLRDILKLRAEREDDPGLTTLSIARVPWRAWHTMAGWVIRRGHQEISDQDRLRLLQFVALDRVLVSSGSLLAIRAPMEQVLGAPDPFPINGIFTKLAEGACFVSPDIIERWLRELDSKSPPEVPAPLRNVEDVLVWCQRHAFHRWFGKYDVTRLLDISTRPWDVDHLVAKARFDKRSGGGSAPDRFYQIRDRWRDDIGNLRLWPAGLNREDRERPLAEKFLLGSQEPGNEASVRQEPWLLPSGTAVRCASGFVAEDCDELDAWEAADSAGPAVGWSEERLLAFERAASLRRRRLMREMVDGLCLRPLLEQLRGVRPTS